MTEKILENFEAITLKEKDKALTNLNLNVSPNFGHQIKEKKSKEIVEKIKQPGSRSVNKVLNPSLRENLYSEKFYTKNKNSEEESKI